MMKSMIFHYPLPIPQEGQTGSQVRPRRMIEAFEQIGYRVDTVIGNAAERKRAIRAIQERLQGGHCYDFMYAESSSAPTLLTEPHHLPLFPFLDFNFFHVIQKQGIPIGMFYRDIHWRFAQYRMHVAWHKRLVTIPFYWYDWFQYRRLVNLLFLPSSMMQKVLPDNSFQGRIIELPPGCVLDHHAFANKTLKEGLTLFYVGSIKRPQYDLRPQFEAIRGLEGINLIICCRREEWQEMRAYYATYGLENVQIVHAFGDELSAYYRQADIFIMARCPDPYLEFSMPVKLFEALGYGLPIIISGDTTASRFVASEEVGWTINSSNELHNLLRLLQNEPEEVERKQQQVVCVRGKYAWVERAKMVADLLSRHSTIVQTCVVPHV